VPAVTKAVNSGLIDVLMFGISLVKHENEEIQALYQACADQDVGLVVMKPYHVRCRDLMEVSEAQSGRVKCRSGD